MALTVQFGNGGSAKTTSLMADKDTYQTLNGPSVTSGQPNNEGDVGQVINGSQKPVDKVAVAGSGTGGTVDVAFTDNTFSFDVSTAWNSVKNAYATSNTGEKVIFTDFVQVDVDFGAAVGNSSVEINDVKRANVTTGSGDDTVKIKLATNDAGWQNIVNVNTGAGVDSITIGKGSTSDIAKVLDGHFTTATIDAGAGNDTIDLGGVNLLSSRVTGGAGNDSITASGGADTFVYGATSNGDDHIYGYNASAGDKLDLTGGTVVAGITTVESESGGFDTIYTLKNAGKVVGHVTFVDTVLAS